MLFPKPEKKPKQKRNREYDREYLRWVHEWPCCVPSCTTKWPVHAHHTVSKAQLGSDRSCVALCAHHHLDWVHGKGIKTTEEKFNINFKEIAEMFYRKFEQGESGPYAHLVGKKKYESF